MTEQQPVTMTEEEWEAQRKAKQEQETEACQKELAELLQRHGRVLVPQLVIQGGEIVSHGLMLVPVQA